MEVIYLELCLVFFKEVHYFQPTFFFRYTINFTQTDSVKSIVYSNLSKIVSDKFGSATWNGFKVKCIVELLKN